MLGGFFIGMFVDRKPRVVLPIPQPPFCKGGLNFTESAKTNHLTIMLGGFFIVRQALLARMCITSNDAKSGVFASLL